MIKSHFFLVKLQIRHFLQKAEMTTGVRMLTWESNTEWISVKNMDLSSLDKLLFALRDGVKDLELQTQLECCK